MKLLRTLALASLLIFTLVLNWNCSDENIPGITGNQVQQTDDPAEKVQLWVHEYCKITPAGGGVPYYQYLQVKLIGYFSWPPYGYTYDNFTTPSADRYDREGNRYETQHFRVIKSSNWKCETGNCAARFNISGVLSEDHFFNHGSCNDCSTPPYSCDGYYDEDTYNLSQNTTYYMFCGADCIVGGDWEND